jgi:GAF domain-containing protein
LTQPTDPLRAFAELGQIKLGETDVDGICDRIAGLARQTLPGADEVSVTLVRDGLARGCGATGGRAQRLDTLQYDGASGPCLQAAAEKINVRIADTAVEDGWDGWTAAAAALDIRAVLSVGMSIHDTVDGALTLYSETPGAFSAEVIVLARSLAEYGAAALANAHLYDSTASLAEHMRKAMERRAGIEQAKGIIMGERRCTPEQAFAILTRISQDSNRKLRDVASALVNKASNTAE